LVTNFEYRIPIAPHVSISIFGDAGATGAVQRDQLQLNTTDYSTLVQQFPFTNINRQLQFQPDTNFKPRTSAGLELVVQLPIVQAPFRIYWAYNFNRMAEVITAPQTQFPGPATVSALTTNCVPPGTNPSQDACPWNIYKAQVPLTSIWDASVVPQILNLYNNPQRTNFFDPIRTFRFTVSRTF
jgi:hypothetical protein